MNEIPIKNIYYMVLYAWNRVKDLSGISEKNIEGLRDFNDVITELFLSEVMQLLRKGISREYINIVDRSEFIKGKIDIASSMKLIQPNIVCHFDEYSEDIILNRVIKTILIRIVSTLGIKDDHRKQARKLLLHFANIRQIYLDENLYKSLVFNRFNKDYEYAIDMGMLIYKNSIPNERDGDYKFINIIDDQEQISSIFEEFLRRFYEIHSGYNVHRRYYNWKWESIDKSNINLLPRMETDIELTTADIKIIIDAKYYKNAFSSKYEGKKLISNNIYQMKAYLSQNLDKYNILRGIIIYPSNGYEINEKFYSNKGYTMEFRTINLNTEWKQIESRLLEIIY